MQRQFGISSTAVVVDQKEHMIHTESEQMGVRGNNTDQHNIGERPDRYRVFVVTK